MKKLKDSKTRESKERLDVYLVEKGYFASREKAKASIMAGIVYVNGQISDKAGNYVSTSDEVSVKENLCPYVSRGGLKLAKSIDCWNISLDDLICADIGASTGGFTDCMLQNGAKKVYAIDVGYGQLDYKLRTDSRVINMEKCNVRYLPEDAITEPIDFISIDVSFISLKLVFPVASSLLSEGGQVVCLVKPQFEAGRQQVGKNGIVREKKVHIEVIDNVIEYGLSNGLEPLGLDFSPVKGAKGNIEYLLFFRKACQISSQSVEIFKETLKVEEIVNTSHEELKSSI